MIPKPDVRKVARNYLKDVPAFSWCESPPTDVPVASDDEVFGKLIIADGDASEVYLGNSRAYFRLDDKWLHDRYQDIGMKFMGTPYRKNGWLEVQILGESLAIFRANPSMFQVERFFRKFG